MHHQSFAKPAFKDSKLDNDVHKTAASKNKLQPACDPLRTSPLTGRIFYLDLPCNKRSLTLESDIKSLGGTVEKFFSKEIRYLVSGKPEARHVQRLAQDSPVPSPDSGLSSPLPGSKRDSLGPRGSSLGPADTVLVSRGKTLVEKVVKEQERFHINRILASAYEWGVKILYVDDVISYVDKKKSKLPKMSTVNHTAKKAAKLETSEGFQKCRAGRISRPFVKVEDSSRQYRPIYLPMPNMPMCNLKSAAPCCPFLVEETCKDSHRGKVKERGSCVDRRARGRRERRRGHEDRRKGGYCECCMVKYEGLKAHLQSEQHLAFSKSEEYLVVDKVISGLTCDLIRIRTPRQRAKFSVSSPLLAPGVAMGRDGAAESDGEEATDGSSLCSSPNAELRSSEEPLPARKRCREPAKDPGEDQAGQSDTLEKSSSKRRSFEWASSSKAAWQKAFGTSLSSTRPACSSDSQEKDIRPLEINSKLRNSWSAPPACRDVGTLRSFATKQNLRSAWCPPGAKTLQGAQHSNEVSEQCAVSHPDIQTAQIPILDIIECSQLSTDRLPNSCHGPIRTEQSVDISHGPDTVERPSSSREHDPSCMDSLSQTLQRKVRDSRSRRRVSAEVPQGLTTKHVESLSAKPCSTASQSQSPSASDLDLRHLFQSSDNVEENDFKGFSN
ncbi:LOW QUALITY PROTEIN: protein DBF4 homolog A [Electrophorus electricus]|uniref:LOW QUALITY PROTEIN: protein DBF4 homolog A n=1 Tax=Electrophorus electricus TaxID=8005 RepID=UPI0015D0CBB6|nr:LOW QUALITY PROTEIN: protein DBF4 homolog A [Electrophorus electricus]